VVRLSRGTWAELQALRPADALGDDRVFPMTAMIELVWVNDAGEAQND
jgi:hypothetical protein